MARTILVTGGGASGKSRWAISQFEACDNVLYICPGKLDDDTRNRIDYSNKKNYVEWDIREGVTSKPCELFNKHKFAVFDDLSSYTVRVMEEMCPYIAQMNPEMEKMIERRIIDDVMAMYEEIKLIEGDIVVITTETGFSLKPEDPVQLARHNILGMVNQRIANVSSDVYLSVSGIQFKIR